MGPLRILASQGFVMALLAYQTLIISVFGHDLRGGKSSPISTEVSVNIMINVVNPKNPAGRERGRGGGERGRGREEKARSKRPTDHPLGLLLVYFEFLFGRLMGMAN